MDGNTGIGTHEDLECSVWQKNSTASNFFYLQSCGVQKPNGIRWSLLSRQFKWDFRLVIGVEGSVCEGMEIGSTEVGALEDLEWTIGNEDLTASISIYFQSCGIHKPNGTRWRLRLNQMKWVCWEVMGVLSDSGRMEFGTIGVVTEEDLEWIIWYENLTASISISLQSCGIQKPNERRRNLTLCQLQWDCRVEVVREVGAGWEDKLDCGVVEYRVLSGCVGVYD